MDYGPNNPVFVALDTPEINRAVYLARLLAPAVGGVKLGLEFFVANGPAGVREVAACGLPVFLDLKLHDIPNTMARAVEAAVSLKPWMITLHAAAGPEALRATRDAAAAAAAALGVPRPRLVAVTVLTSLGDEDLSALGMRPPTLDQVARLAVVAEAAGLDGVVCSAREVPRLRATLGASMTLVVPGLRPAWAAAQDQKRVVTPEKARQDGADWLVLGRPITGAEDPLAAARAVVTALDDAGE